MPGRLRWRRTKINRMIMKKEGRGKGEGRKVANKYFDSDFETRICSKKSSRKEMSWLMTRARTRKDAGEVGFGRKGGSEDAKGDEQAYRES